MIFPSTATVFVLSQNAKCEMKITSTMIDENPGLLRDLLDYDAETGALTWRVRGPKWFAKDRDCEPWNARYAGKPAFTVQDTYGYLNGKIFSKRYLAHRVIWAIVHACWPEQVDHINGSKADNRIANLREVSNAGNAQNRKRPNTNTSGVVGVVWHKQKQRWQAQIGVGDRMVCLGRFTDKDEAIAARKAAEVAHGYHANHGREVAA